MLRFEKIKGKTRITFYLNRRKYPLWLFKIVFSSFYFDPNTIYKSSDINKKIIKVDNDWDEFIIWCFGRFTNKKYTVIFPSLKTFKIIQ